ncbi:Fur-regulated basic protein FbpA [Bacillus sp. DNRA2]|uniref:Fur-regulated basic protein FbpA n=1 Tax=Bacillus sp. DNRA2 TaxID=2723053 RepID=UPI00145F61E7|nr:Fur-regulated basic protein FbpA [Bacillus sp. DNRA2]NMD69705.1 Fur-regulated basic protein FbpA [Bacillus sp. DNRA2]
MPLLREAVENLRLVFINRLIRIGAYKQSDPMLHKLTLSELIDEYKNTKKDYKTKQRKQS